MYVVLVYDISQNEDGKKVLPKVFKTCKKYLSHVQNSVFEGDITAAQIMQLQIELQHYIRKEYDSVILFRTRDEKWLTKEFWGISIDLTSNFI